ncbi:hypothetical protein DOTSEDRAFT_65936 [Dothistroma septosporum NZE10]|uniref:Amidohydrolase-related domain-containing protein n=1 Tax=Dothistroma septosporum (strain NZE10 / CBS 128990) TaxID=675120 RepID=N1PCP0_DOTSN|nr:hypothetical protein DOTSEDRAFT_65936 [Dothistroma septosporum NZE10]
MRRFMIVSPVKANTVLEATPAADSHPSVTASATSNAMAMYIQSILIVCLCMLLELVSSLDPILELHPGDKAHQKQSALRHLPGSGTLSTIILQGTVLSPFGPFDPGYVYVRDGRIARIGVGHGPHCGKQRATIIDCKGSVITPGFINLHEHVEYSLIDPLLDTGERYGARNEWREGLNNKSRREPKVIAGTERNATAWGELRHLFSGTTSIVGNGYIPGLTRNLDGIGGLGEDLKASVNQMANFPLDDRSGILRLGDCDYGPNAVRQGGTDGLLRYMAHIGEGISAQAHNEFRCLSSQTFDTTPRADGSGISVDIITPSLVVIQANSLPKEDFDMIARRGAKVVWSPRSNIALYGSTLDVTYLLKAGIAVALGTDWLPSGSATMSREARCAKSAMESIYNTTIDAETLWQMMTIDAARVAGFDDQIGSLEVGKLADIAVWGGDTKFDPYARAIFAPMENVELVMRGGEILLTSSALNLHLEAAGCERVLFGAVEKSVCVESALNTTFAAFQSALQGRYPAILPGVPRDEPTCEPVIGQ